MMQSLPATPEAGMLPSIHEMFPEHLMQARPSVGPSRPYDQQAAALRVGSRASGKGSMLQVSAPGLDMDLRAYSRIVYLPPSGAHDANDDGASGADKGKFVCPTCWKRFNRPSSLRTHINTHTGETPFRCPWPNCGRGFNVNSNMRRHYRNHTNPQYRSRPPSSLNSDNMYPSGVNNDASRGRARLGHPLVPERAPSMPISTSEFIAYNSPYNTPPPSNASAYDYSDEEESERMDIYQDGEEEESVPTPLPLPPQVELEKTKGKGKGKAAETAETASSSPWFFQLSECPPRRFQTPSFNPSYAVSQSRPQTSPSPPSTHVYTASAPYMRSLSDSKVSTALRPAFA
ncbi:hypothetical protein Hypma_011750 [Hypsizygus marmoreus]|uniref:C2H2-type domain-containing protein n=1 Tax=Hypsizygus marmoreus TaxID=39966 RepID=A0A369JKX2_HYPMA|nr:hypothetical protein Hypma_011750 [Hypsizygus marmoreus]